MKYDFDKIIDRRNTASLKWDVKDNELPMWVADMDFEAAPEITEALKNRLLQGIFGYEILPDAWYESYINWWDKRHGLKMEKENLIFSTGVIPSISSIVRKLTTPNENVLIQTPVYNVFFNCIENNGCRVAENVLVYKDNAYTMDLEDLEKKMADPQTNLMIFCNPHNPVGKIWDRDTLATVGSLAKKYHVTVISDEIHCDITVPGKDYIPFACVSEDCREVSITCIAPTKAFNLAGLHTSAVYVANPFLRHKVWRALNTDEVAEPNSFATAASIAAFEKGAAWLDEMRAYVFENKKTVTEFLKKEVPKIKAVETEATYLMWLDISQVSDSGRKFAAYLRAKTGLFVTGGEAYGTGGEHFLRMNVACPKSICMDGLNRLKAGAESFPNT